MKVQSKFQGRYCCVHAPQQEQPVSLGELL